MRAHFRRRRKVLIVLVALGVIGTVVLTVFLLPDKRMKVTSLGPVESDVYELLVAAGASSAEAICLSGPLSKGAEDIGDVFNNLPGTGTEDTGIQGTADAVHARTRTAEAVNARAPGCASLARIRTVLKGVDRVETREAEQALEALRKQSADLYRSRGASEAEITCMVTVWFGPPGGPEPPYWEDLLTAQLQDPEAVREENSAERDLTPFLEASRKRDEALLQCATRERLEQLGG